MTFINTFLKFSFITIIMINFVCINLCFAFLFHKKTFNFFPSLFFAHTQYVLLLYFIVTLFFSTVLFHEQAKINMIFPFNEIFFILQIYVMSNKKYFRS